MTAPLCFTAVVYWDEKGAGGYLKTPNFFHLLFLLNLFNSITKWRGFQTANIPLDDYTAFLYNWCAALPGIDKACLRDAMVRDRLATNSTGRLPQCLHVTDALLGRAVKRLAQNPATAPLPGVRRGVALLYGTRQVVFVDYTQKNPVTGRYLLHTRSIDNLFTE